MFKTESEQPPSPLAIVHRLKTPETTIDECFKKGKNAWSVAAENLFLKKKESIGEKTEIFSVLRNSTMSRNGLVF